MRRIEELEVLSKGKGMSEFAELEALWEDEQFQVRYLSWRDQRVRFALDVAPRVHRFLSGHIGTWNLHKISEEWTGQGFLRGCYRFLENLIRWSNPVELDDTLRLIFRPPEDVDEAERKLHRFCELVDQILLSGRGIEPRRTVHNGESIPRGFPDLGNDFVAPFASFFWGIVLPDGWPIMLPVGRDLLIEHQPIDGERQPPDIYVEYCDQIGELKARTGIDSWTAEFLLIQAWLAGNQET